MLNAETQGLLYSCSSFQGLAPQVLHDISPCTKRPAVWHQSQQISVWAHLLVDKLGQACLKSFS